MAKKIIKYQPVVVNGKYLKHSGPAELQSFLLTPEAVIDKDKGLIDLIKVSHVQDKNAILPATKSNATYDMVYFGFTYPGGDTSSSICIKDVVVENRPNLGVSVTKPSANGSFKSSYMETYASIGIPTPIWEKLYNGMLVSTGHARVDTTNIRTYKDYTWLSANLPSNGLQVSVKRSDGTIEHYGALSLFQFAQQSIMGIATLSLRLRKPTTVGGGVKNYTVGASLGNFSVSKYTTISSPPLADTREGNDIVAEMDKETMSHLENMFEGLKVDKSDDVTDLGNTSTASTVNTVHGQNVYTLFE